MQVGPAQVGLHQRAAAQVEGEQVGILQVGPVQVGVAQAKAGVPAVVDQIDAGQLGVLQLEVGHRLAVACAQLQGGAEPVDLALVHGGILPEGFLDIRCGHGATLVGTSWSVGGECAEARAGQPFTCCSTHSA
ncbi:hypothetical protein D3C80_1757250 [compost metagenome]